MAVEALLKCEVPPRAQYLRVIWSELSRLHSHLLWFGLMADAFGFESLFMHSWRIREKILDIIEETTGGRVIFASSKVGGVRRDISDEKLREILERLGRLEPEIRELTRVFLNDGSVKHRTRGVGILSKEDAYALGAVGPTLRGSGVPIDMRVLGYAAYGRLGFEPVTEPEGDCYGRSKVRVRELFQSLELIRRSAGEIPQGPIETKVTGVPNGEYFARAEQPRGEVIYYAKSDGTRFLKRLRVRTPTFANLPALIRMLPGSSLADVPVLVLTIDPCISCTER
jgi:ech hydrogenase subunit E